VSAFDPTRHRLVPELRWVEDFTLGERFALPIRTMTDALVLPAQAASEDNHPITTTSHSATRGGACRTGSRSWASSSSRAGSSSR